MSSLSPLIGKRSRRNLPPVDWFLVSLEAIVGPLLGDRACYALSSKIRRDQIVTRTDPVILAILGSPPSSRPGPIHLDEEAAQASRIHDGVAEAHLIQDVLIRIVAGNRMTLAVGRLGRNADGFRQAALRTQRSTPSVQSVQ